MDNQQRTDEGLRELALFAGAGGGILGGKLLGWRTVCAVEIEPYPASVLAARQNDGILAPFPIWDDICTFDGRPWRGRVDVVSGGFPCQDISSAGKKAGIEGVKSGLWKEMARVVGEIRPQNVFVENSPMLIRNGLSTVISDFAEMGYDTRWCVLGARHIGGIHKRDRLWLLATDIQNADTVCRDGQVGRDVPGNWWEPATAAAYLVGSANREPWFLGRHHGMACLMDRLKAIGNGQVPAVAALAWEILSG